MLKLHMCGLFIIEATKNIILASFTHFLPVYCTGTDLKCRGTTFYPMENTALMHLGTICNPNYPSTAMFDIIPNHTKTLKLLICTVKSITRIILLAFIVNFSGWVNLHASSDILVVVSNRRHLSHWAVSVLRTDRQKLRMCKASNVAL